jgi:hypothetical protein
MHRAQLDTVYSELTIEPVRSPRITVDWKIPYSAVITVEETDEGITIVVSDE